MSFSRAQQPAFRQMVKEAWLAVGRDVLQGQAGALKSTPDRDWYEQELYYATGCTSSTECDAGHDYDFAMAHFEELAGAGIRWQMKVKNGDAKRLIYNVQKIARGFNCDEAYLRGIARQALGTAHLPALDKLTPEQRVTVLRAVKIEVRRLKARGEEPHLPVRTEALALATPGDDAPEIDIPF
jgi:hypothetical protein